MTSNQLLKPIFIIACNRSGTTLLFRNLSSHPRLWSLYIESQDIFYRHYPIHEKWGDTIFGNVPEKVRCDIINSFFKKTRNKEIFKDTFLLNKIPGKLLQYPLTNLIKKPPIRIVEKTPANCFRIPALKQIFPDAKFIFMIRRGEDVVSSLMEGWKNWSKTGDDNFHFGKWHYLVPPDWQEWKTKSLQEICAFQWIESNLTAWKDLNTHCKEDFVIIRHEDIMSDPIKYYKKILAFCELPFSKHFMEVISNINKRVYTTGGSKPKKNKWKELHFQEINSVKSLIKPVMDIFY